MMMQAKHHHFYILKKSHRLIMGKKRKRIKSADTYLFSTTLPLAKPMANILSGSGLGYHATV